MTESKKVKLTPPKGKSLTLGVTKARTIDPEKVRVALGAEKAPGKQSLALQLRKPGRVR